jgi:hypothetical protein
MRGVGGSHGYRYHAWIATADVGFSCRNYGPPRKNEGKIRLIRVFLRVATGQSGSHVYPCDPPTPPIIFMKF